MKQWLNSSIWKKDPAAPWSNDFWSPFDMLPGNKPIETAYILGLLAAGCILFFRKVPVGLAFAWGASLFLGLGYVRMFGYLALCSAAVILVALSRSVARGALPWLNRAGWIGVAVWICVSWALLLSGLLDQFIPEGQHVSRVGQTPIYDDTIADWVKSEFPEEKVFTTIETGSYCLLRWDFEKQVFIDGFFVPHTREVWSAYLGARNRGDLSALLEQFGMTLAIIPTTSENWVDRFRLSADWRPVAVGNGSAVFAHSSLAQKIKKPEIFARANALGSSSLYFRHAALKTLFLIAARESGDAFGFTSADWTSQAAFTPLQKMAAEVFPIIETFDSQSGE